ncbi:MAG TPA: hypothetical protein PLB96_00995 [Syntrophales bacterium]|nr:hypothetical protein [Syntrophales bacterium]
MRTDSGIERYLGRWSRATDRPLLCGGSLEGFGQAVVIPALAERETIFASLASLSRNDPKELARTLVLVVVNNRRPPHAREEDIRDNQDTLRCLKELLKGRLPELRGGAAAETTAAMEEILRGGLRMAVFDASSPGNEMPLRAGGVGLARRMGMDAALGCLDRRTAGAGCLFCLDADTLVDANYLSEAARFFRSGNWAAAAVDFAHRIDPENPLEKDAIRRYEIYLRYYQLGLSYAGSPYAFFTIGSTMVCRDQAYAAVRGMPVRDAAEDFYFFNKLAKVGPIGRISGTRVHPSSRRSARVPFGTGSSVGRYLEGDRGVDRLYDPQIFAVLKAWLCRTNGDVLRDEEDVLATAQRIHPALGKFLAERRFPAAWRRIRRSTRRAEVLRRHFHSWFDGFQTLKLVHWLTDALFPRIDAAEAVERLCRMQNAPLREPVADGSHAAEGREALLDHLRRVQPRQGERIVA